VAGKIRFHPKAEQEAEGAVQWYRERSTMAAAGFVAELSHAVQQVAETPERWPRYIANTRRYIFPVYPFSLIYRLLQHEVTIVAVAHAKRKPGYWISRKD